MSKPKPATTESVVKTQAEMPVVKGYSNALKVHLALTEPYVPFERAPEIQSIISMFVKWNEKAMDAGKANMPNAFEQLNATDIAYIDDAKLHDVNYQGKPLGKKRIAELEPFEQRQSRSQSYEYACVTYEPLKTPFLTNEQRKHIQSMFPVADYPFAEVLRIHLKGKRPDAFNHIMVICIDNTMSTWITHFLMQSKGKPAAA